MRVDVWSDVVCPWCYVGKARFEKALSTFGHRDEVEVVFRSFELDPERPERPKHPERPERPERPEGPEGPTGQRETVLSMLSSKYGMTEDQARAADARVAGLARAEGLGFDSNRLVGNTFDIHRVTHLGLAKGVQQELITAVNEAYFAQARPVFDRDVLTEVAVGAGLDPVAVGDVLAGDDYADAVREDELQARQLGISGVPFFVFDMALGVSGAQSAQTFTNALNQAWARRG